MALSRPPHRSTPRRSFVEVVCAGAMWALSGASAQVLFHSDHLSPLWLVCVRMLGGGVILGASSLRDLSGYRKLWSNPKDAVRVVIFALFGLVSVQISYAYAIADSNVVTATVLQYLAPALLGCYIAIRTLKLPKRVEIISLVIAVLGTILLSTNGHMSTLSLPIGGVLWGLLSAVCAGIYTYYPRHLISNYGTRPVLVSALLCGGVATSPSLLHLPHLTWTSASLVGFVVVFGTVISFAMYLSSLKVLAALQTAIASCTEPVVAAVVGVVALHAHLGLVGAIGGVGVITAVITLAISGGESMSVDDRASSLQLPP